ncbi:E3 ubiquitin-protein ligase sina-like [Anthonomus grandis grandis]|uniref:E3 ubiquitin-protein ligase sina-like n=1 Tax=Anthonomus grandis grandis TaxID=2921223 RepID=UPI002165990B|nr:E3 ubiquitin-protein ligase sina-like [Anthonomus grandis grandis]
MASSLDPTKVAECPLCLDIITPPVSQCDVGHSMCKKCFQQSKQSHCPICLQPMTNRRHVAFEQLLESLRDKLEITCRYSSNGCKYQITPETKETHERDCRHRTFKCEGNLFADWKCNWTGRYEDLENHFKREHKNHTVMQYRTEATLKINFQRDFKDIQLISFFNGQAYFYYKHRVNVQKQKVYWAFQYIGLKSNAEHFFYEFEIHNGPIRKFKVTEICTNDTVRVEDTFELEKCVVMSFASLRNYLDAEGELSFRFRIIKYKPNHVS